MPRRPVTEHKTVLALAVAVAGLMIACASSDDGPLVESEQAEDPTPIPASPTPASTPTPTPTPEDADPTAIPSPAQAPTSSKSACPVAEWVCEMAGLVERWAEDGDAGPLLRAVSPATYECPGRDPPGVGDPTPLCDGAAPGERRESFSFGGDTHGGATSTAEMLELLEAIHPGDEAGPDDDYGTGALRRWSIGCSTPAAEPGACEDGVAIVYSHNVDWPAQLVRQFVIFQFDRRELADAPLFSLNLGANVAKFQHIVDELIAGGEASEVRVGFGPWHDVVRVRYFVAWPSD